MMYEKKRYFIFPIAIFILLNLACGVSFDLKQEDSTSQRELELQLTEVVMRSTQAAMAAIESSNKEQSNDSTSDLETESKDASEEEIPCNASRMVSETIPDGTTFQAGETFKKSWTLRNAGTCDWTTDYKFIFESGYQMGGNSSVNIPYVIESGDTVTFSVDLTAPSADGEYTGVWRLKANDGEKLGKYWAMISVGSVDAGDSQPSGKEDGNGLPPPSGGGYWGQSEPQCGDGVVEGNEECDPPGTWCGRDLLNGVPSNKYCASYCTCTIWGQ